MAPAIRTTARALGTLAALGALGCGGEGEARTFQVTLTEDFESYRCEAVVPEGLPPSASNLAAKAADKAEKRYRDAHGAGEATPRGLGLTVTDREGSMRSWFSTSAPGACTANGAPCYRDQDCCGGRCETDFGVCRAGLELSSDEVYVGAPIEEVVLGTYAPRTDLPSTPFGNPADAEPICEGVIEIRSELAATVVGELIDGRVRRTDVHLPEPFLGSVYCDLHVDCSRDYTLTGVEE